MVRRTLFLILILAALATVPSIAPTPIYASPSPQSVAFPGPGLSVSGSIVRSITIDHTKVPNTDQTNFPVVVTGTYLYLRTLANGGNVTSASGFDIFFSSTSNCGSILKFQRAFWSGSTGVVEFWIKIATVSHTVDTVFYLCYGSPTVTTDQSDPTNVWTNGFISVYHMGDGTTLSGSDSTANALNGTVDVGATATAGQMDGGGSFTGNSDSKITVGTSATFNVANITVSCWMKTSDVTGADRNMIDRDDAGANRVFQFRKSSTQKLNFIPFVSGANSITGGTTINTGAWFYVAGTYDGSNVRIYVNGVSDATAVAVAGSMPSRTLGLKIGAFFGGSQFFIGQIDEARIASSARAADWLLTEFNNQNSPSTFYTISSPL